MKKIIVGLSGGIDSAVALFLLKNQGWQPIGITLKLPVWRNKDQPLSTNICCHPQALEISKKICQLLDVSYYLVDAREDFFKNVVNYFIEEIKKGATPNPCVRCNRYFKFPKLFELAKKLKVEYIATGHYAKIEDGKLLKGKDKIKDQSYYLSFLPKKWLGKIIFPLGNYTKKEVYKLAKKMGLNFWQKIKQSQDFCYLGGQPLEEFIKENLPLKEGLIIQNKYKILGKHRGLFFYTLGQRQGIKLGGGPFYVKEKNWQKNQLIITKDKKELYRKELILSPFNLLKKITKPTKVMAKVRYHQVLKPAELFYSRKKLKIIFDSPIFCPTPGQVCVFYQKNICLGGGIISKIFKDK